MQHYGIILAGTDFTPPGDSAVRAALAIAERQPAARLHLAHVVPVSGRYLTTGAIAPYPLPDAVFAPMMQVEREAGERKLADLPLPETKVPVIKETRLGIPARELHRLAEELHAELIVLGSIHRNKLARLLVGSVGDALIRSVHCPVLVVGEDRPGAAPFARVLAAVDLSAVTPDVILHAAALARSSGAVLKVLSAIEPVVLRPAPGDVLPTYLTPEESAKLVSDHLQALERITAGLDLGGVTVEHEVSRERPLDAIRAALDGGGIDLVAVGTSGHSGWQRMMLGSTANKVIAEAPCPVLVVPAPSP